MLVSPMLRASLAAALLLCSAQAMPEFLKATSPLRTSSSPQKQRLLANLMSKAQPRRRLDQGDDQAQDEDWNNFGFDVQNYSVKYTGCSAIKTYSDEQAQEGDSVLESKRFVVFRLCPSDSCNQYSSDGCSSDFGEYVLEMGDYLEAMTMYQEEKAENFCAYCEWCAENQWYGGNDDAAAAQGDDAAAQGDDAQRRLDQAAGDDAAAADGDDAAAQGDDAAAAAEEEACSMCSSYNQVCNQNNQNQNNGDDQQEQYEMDQFFECFQIQNQNNGNAYYLGPHCASDGFTISIGLYSDETCSTYIGLETSIYDAVGIDLSGLDMSIYTPKECQSCMENEFEYENNNGDNEDEDNINEMCEDLYMASAKCNQNFDTVNADAYYSAQQQANEEQVCNFIDNIKSGKYDEDGDIIIDAYQFDVSHWKDGDQYSKFFNSAKEDVTPVQISFLVITIVGCFILSVAACCLHGSLTRKGLQWRPRRGKWTNPTDISRQNSGIVMGRSRSGMNGPLV